MESANTARVFDGGTLLLGDPQERQLQLFGSRVVTVDPGALNGAEGSGLEHGDDQLFGASARDAVTVPGTQLEAYWFLRRNADAGDALDTVGARVESVVGRARLEAEGAGQFGAFGHLPQRAYMAHAGGSYGVPVAGSRFGAAYSFASGDADPDDERHGTFDSLFPSRAHHGQMELWSLQNGHDLEASWSAKPSSGIHVRLAWHGFWLHRPESDAWYNASQRPVRLGRPGASAYVGQELDLAVAARFWRERLVVSGGYGHFFAGDFVRETGASEDADFAFVQVAGAMTGGLF